MPVVVLTQERAEAQRQADELATNAIPSLVYPCIETHAIVYEGRLPLTQPISEFDVLAFTSRRGVAGMLPYRDQIGAGTVIACVGETTARAARELLGHPVAIIPPRATAEQLAQQIIGATPPGRLLQVRGTLGGQGFRNVLEQASWEVEEFFVYKNAEPHLESLHVDSDAVAVFASPSAVERFFKVNPGLKSTLRCVAIGPVTTESLRAAGVGEVHVAARPELLLATVRSLIGGVIHHDAV